MVRSYSLSLRRRDMVSGSGWWVVANSCSLHWVNKLADLARYLTPFAPCHWLWVSGWIHLTLGTPARVVIKWRGRNFMPNTRARMTVYSFDPPIVDQIDKSMISFDLIRSLFSILPSYRGLIRPQSETTYMRKKWKSFDFLYPLLVDWKGILDSLKSM